jgi:hypothetical protein
VTAEQLEKVMENTKRKQTEPRILARRLARPLTEGEVALVAGGAARATVAVGGKIAAPACDTWSCTGCPVNDSDS